jgi:hypothetical protein
MIYTRIKPPLGIRPDWSNPITKGLVGCWLMNEGGGNLVNDLSGNGNRGTITNALWAPGKFGSCLSFDGTGDYVNLGNKIFTPGGAVTTNDFTLSLWVNTSAGATSRCMGKYQDADRRLYLRLDTAIVDFYARTTAGAIIDIGGVSTGLIAGQWTHVAIVAPRGRTPAFFIHGISRSLTYSTCTTGTLENTGDLHLGGYNGTGWPGLIDHLQIYNRALSASEIARLYQEPFAMFRRRQIWPSGAGGEATGFMTTNTKFWG